MTIIEMEAMSAGELAAELDWSEPGIRAATFLIRVRDAVVKAARLYPDDAVEAPDSLAHDIASGTDWSLGVGGEDWHWTMAFRLSKILLNAFDPENA